MMQAFKSDLNAGFESDLNAGFEIEKFADISGHYRRNSEVWNYFDFDEATNKARCRESQCGKEYHLNKPQTTTMWRHLKSAHNMDVKTTPRSSVPTKDDGKERVPGTTEAGSASFQGGLPDHRDNFPPTGDQHVAKLVAVHNLYMKTIASTRGLQVNGHTLPDTRQAVRKSLHNFYIFAKEHLCSDIKILKSEGTPFCISLNEATWRKHQRRFININLHLCKQIHSLGLIRVRKSDSVESVKHAVEERIEQFGLSLHHDVTAAISDRWSVAGKMAAISPLKVQCLAHALHLAVFDLLYTKTKKDDVNMHRLNDFSDHDNSEDDDDEEEGGCADDDQLFAYAFDGLKGEYQDVCDKVRKVVRVLKTSTAAKRRKSQLNLNAQFDDETKALKSDCGTRWNSLLAMLERFYVLKDAVFAVMKGEEYEVRFYEDEIAKIKSLIDALQPIAAAVQFLGKDEVDISTADQFMDVTLKCVARLGTTISARLCANLHERVTERRHSTLLHLFEVLKQPRYLRRAFDYCGARISKDEVFGLAEELWTRLHRGFMNEQTSSMYGGAPIGAEYSMIPSAADPYLHHNTVVNIRRELDRFIEAPPSELRSPAIVRLMRILQNIRPTAVAATRAYSAPGFFMEKYTTHFSDDTLNKQTFLKTYFHHYKSS